MGYLTLAASLVPSTLSGLFRFATAVLAVPILKCSFYHPLPIVAVHQVLGEWHRAGGEWADWGRFATEVHPIGVVPGSWDVIRQLEPSLRQKFPTLTAKLRNNMNCLQ
jgi:hypothetical protein